MFAFVVAQDSPNISINGTDVENIQQAVDDYSPIDEEGNVNLSKYKPYKSKAGERIDNINLWLEENASWLSAVFGMVPSITWLFAMNVYIILFFLVNLFFNGDIFGFVFTVLEKKIDFIFFETRWANIFGFGIFAVLLVTKVYVNIAKFAMAQWNIIWNYILPWGIAIAVILTILAIVGLILLMIFAPQVLQAIGQAMKKRKEKKRAEKTEGNEEVLEKIVKGATGE